MSKDSFLQEARLGFHVKGTVFAPSTGKAEGPPDGRPESEGTPREAGASGSGCRPAQLTRGRGEQGGISRSGRIREAFKVTHSSLKCEVFIATEANDRLMKRGEKKTSANYTLTIVIFSTTAASGTAAVQPTQIRCHTQLGPLRPPRPGPAPCHSAKNMAGAQVPSPTLP